MEMIVTSKLSEQVLVLNKNWLAIRVRNAKKAIMLLSRDRACVVDTNDYSIYKWDDWINLPCEEGEGISTTRGEIKVPSVILLTVYGKIPKSAPRLTKKNLFIRDGYTCQYTGKKVSTKDADIDHIIPSSRNGKNSWDNMVVCSKKVNRMKADKTLVEAGLKLIKKPKKPSGTNLMLDPRIEIPEAWSKFIK
jgi:5-methylcytosine-specific restriction endonuclease McrA